MDVGARGVRSFGARVTVGFKLTSMGALTELWSSERVIYVGSYLLSHLFSSCSSQPSPLSLLSLLVLPLVEFNTRGPNGTHRATARTWVRLDRLELLFPSVC